MSEKYTMGPWQLSAPEDRYDTWLILCSAPHEVAHIAPRFKSGERDKEQEEANARRIVACVNACDGVDTELLESRPAPFSELREERDSLLKQRDVLLDALIKIMQWNSHPRNCGVEYGSNGVRDFYRNTAYNAIANIRGKA